MAVNFTKLEFASAVICRVLEQKFDDVSVVATCAYDSSKKSLTNDERRYFRHIAFTQRVVKDSRLVCYVTYRTKNPYTADPLGPAFSSIEIFGPGSDYDLTKSFKARLEDYPSSEEAVKAALENIINRITK